MKALRTGFQGFFAGLLACALLVGCKPTSLLGDTAVAFYGSLFPPSRELTYRQVEGDDLVMAVFEPPGGHGGEPRPTLLFFHGGGWTMGHRAMLYPQASALADQGWLTLSAAYRTHGSHETNAHVALDDARAALHWVIAQADELGVDPSRLVVAGGSAGGHLAAATALLEADLSVAAMVLFNPAVDTSFEQGPDSWQRIAPLFDDRGREISPLHLVGAGAPPAVVFHGTDDEIVPFDHSRRFCERLAEVGSACQLEAFPGEGHGFFNYGFGRFDAVMEKTRAFLRARELAPAPEVSAAAR